MFYSGSKEFRFDEAVKRRDNLNYYCGTAKYWMDNINMLFCTKEDFVCADLLCFNYCLFNRAAKRDFDWFPEAYVYDNKYTSVLKPIAIRLASVRYSKQFIPAFSFEEVESFKERFKEIETNSRKGHYKDFRYPANFHSAPLLCEFISADAIGTFP